MSFSLEDIKNAFKKYINIYVGLIIPENKIYDEYYLISKIGEIAGNNKIYTNEFCKIIIDHLTKDEIKFKLKLFNIIDSLFKSVGKDYIDKLSKYLFGPFKECFTMSDFNDRILLFKIFYTWKYLLPKNILDKIREDLKLDDFKDLFMKTYPGKIEKYDEYNEKMKSKLEGMNNNNKIDKNKMLNKINLSKAKNSNNNQNSTKKIVLEKKFKEDNYPNETNNNINISSNIKQTKAKNKVKKSANKKMIGHKRKSSQEKSIDENISTNKVKSISNPMNNNNLYNLNLNNAIIDNNNIINNNNNNQNDISINQNNINNMPLSFLINSGINLANLTNNLPNINNPQNNAPFLPQNQQQQQQQQQKQQLIQNLILNMITSNNPLFSSSNQNQVKPSIIEYQIYQFIQHTNINLNPNLRFFSSIAKYYNEALQKRDIIDIKCRYEDIYSNEAYKGIRQKIDSKLFKDIKKNICAICGFRTLFYTNLTEHLDIHFNVNYLQMEGKNIFRKKAHNRKNWITGENNKDNKNKVGYTLSNLLYYKNMMNNNLVNMNKEQEEDNEEFMYPVYDESREVCHYCGDELKKVFSSKYHYWFYNKVIIIIEDKQKNLVHQSCYDEMSKKV